MVPILEVLRWGRRGLLRFFPKKDPVHQCAHTPGEEEEHPEHPEEEGKDLMTFVKEAYRYKADRVLQALDKVTGEE